MTHGLTPSAWRPRLLFALGLVLLLTIGVIQYQWFSRAASSEIHSTIQTLEFSVRQTVTREFQRFSPVEAEVRALAQSGDQTPDSVMRSADRILQLYGSTGSVATLVSWIGVHQAGQSTYWKANQPTVWQKQPLPSEDWVQALGPEATPGGPPPRNVLTFRLGPGRPTVVLSVDANAFFDAYAFPALRELFPGARMTWREDPMDAPPAPEAFNPETYAFSPLAVLVWGPSLSSQLTVSIPRMIEWGPLPKSSIPETKKPVNLRVFSSWSVLINLGKDAPLFTIESRLAGTWLAGTFLLVVLALAFTLVLFQWEKAAALRRTEREFVASVSHELRTPLTVIRSAADNFQRGIVPPDRIPQYSQIILDQSLRLGRMIEEMLTFARTERSGSNPTILRRFAWNPWIQEVQTTLNAVAAEQGVELLWSIEALSDEAMSDPDGLRLILENLVINGVNHAYSLAGPETPRVIRVSLRGTPTGWITLTVEDDGRGIAPHEARKVFEPFYRDHVSRENQERGSGLGLFLARRQASQMGGKLTLDSPWRRSDGPRRSGCRFTVRVPTNSKNADHL